MYSTENAEDRPNRISGYAFNPAGGLGAGSYFQDGIRAGDWIHYVLVINTAATSGEYPHGYTKVFRDGVLRDQDDLSLTAGHRSGPGRCAPAHRDKHLESFFQGGIGKVAVYSHELSPERIARHYEVMSGRKPAEAG